MGEREIPFQDQLKEYHYDLLNTKPQLRQGLLTDLRIFFRHGKIVEKLKNRFTIYNEHAGNLASYLSQQMCLNTREGNFFSAAFRRKLLYDAVVDISVGLKRNSSRALQEEIISQSIRRHIKEVLVMESIFFPKTFLSDNKKEIGSKEEIPVALRTSLAMAGTTIAQLFEAHPLHFDEKKLSAKVQETATSVQKLRQN